MKEEELLSDISKKLNVVIGLMLRQLLDDREFKYRRKQGVGDIARFLADSGIDPKDIAQILGAPITSVRTLLTPHRRK